ncbi:MAG: hypothetical protein M0Z77_03665 [Thermoplasmatales archaeon]|nr:hypothetical protein [Thermoplasmatales archaeon]
MTKNEVHAILISNGTLVDNSNVLDLWRIKPKGARTSKIEESNRIVMTNLISRPQTSKDRKEEIEDEISTIFNNEEAVKLPMFIPGDNVYSVAVVNLLFFSCIRNSLVDLGSI